jgi:hypothetical protein
MTIKDVFIRFSLIYILSIVAVYIINALLKYSGISPIRSIGFLFIFLATAYACDAFAKKNKRYFTPEEKKKVVIGFIIINFLIEAILMAISGMANKLGGNVLLIAFGLMLIINPLLIYIFVGLAGISARKRYSINKDEVKLSSNGEADEVIQSNNIPQETFGTLWAMWILSVLPLLVFLYVGYTLGNQVKQPLNIEGRSILFYIFLIITLLISYLLRKHMLSVKNIAASSVISTTASQVDKTLYVRKYSRAVMVSYLLSFFISVYGIILFYSGSNFLNLLIFVAISFICLCYYRPQNDEFNNMVSSMQNINSIYQDNP